MDRIEKIRKFHEQNLRAQEDNEKAKKDRTEVLKARIRGLIPRISKLIETAQVCVESDIDIDKAQKLGRSYDVYEKGTFVANGFSHRLGFIVRYIPKSSGVPAVPTVTGIGILNGGCCGNIDLVVTTTMITGVDNSCSTAQCEPRLTDLEAFVSSFNEFESAFYAYIDNIIGEYEESTKIKTAVSVPASKVKTSKTGDNIASVSLPDGSSLVVKVKDESGYYPGIYICKLEPDNEREVDIAIFEMANRITKSNPAKIDVYLFTDKEINTPTHDFKI